MKYIKYFLLTIFLFLFTGCFAPVKMNYTEQYVERNLKHKLKQVKTKDISIIPTYEEFIKNPTSIHGKLRTIEIKGNLNDFILVDFFNQYFEDVSISNKEAYLVVKSEIKDFTYSNDFQGGMTFTISLDITVKKDGKTILKKVYTETPPDGVTIIFTFRELSPFEFNNEDLHKGLLWIYETKFKPDLLRALKEHI